MHRSLATLAMTPMTTQCRTARWRCSEVVVSTFIENEIDVDSIIRAFTVDGRLVNACVGVRGPEAFTLSEAARRIARSTTLLPAVGRR